MEHSSGLLRVVILSTVTLWLAAGTPLVHPPEECVYNPPNSDRPVTRHIVARLGCTTFQQSTDPTDWDSFVSEDCADGTMFDLDTCDCNDPEVSRCSAEALSNWISPDRPHFPGTEEDGGDSSQILKPPKELGLLLGLILGLLLPVLVGVIAAIIVVRRRARDNESAASAASRSAQHEPSFVRSASGHDTQPMLQDRETRGHCER